MARSDWRPLVELAHGDAVAAVLRDPEDGWLWLSADSRRRGGTGISDYGASAEGWYDEWVVGGALPPGATRAQVLSDSGDWVDAEAANGAWVVVLEGSRSFGEHVVRYFDESHAVVARPLPPGAALTPVPDASEPCVACGSTDWNVARGSLEMLVPDGWADHSGGYVDHKTVVCAKCGHQEAVGAFMSVSIDDSDPPWPAEEDVSPEDQAEAAKALAEARAEFGSPLEDADFPVYGLDDSWRGARALGGAGSSDGRLDSVTLDHGSRDDPRWVRVTTAAPDEHDRDEPAVRRVEEAYTQVAQDLEESWPHVSEEALTVWLRSRDRERRRAVVARERHEARIVVDGLSVLFATMGSDQRWAASANHGKLHLTIVAVGVAPEALRLVAIDDPSPYPDFSF